MKSSMLTRATTAILCVVVAFAGLSACGSSSSSDSNEESSSEAKTDDTKFKMTTFSELLNGKPTIWFRNGMVTAAWDDVHIPEVLVFENKKVTIYSNGEGCESDPECGIFYRDFKGVSDDQMLEKIKELNHVAFDKYVAKNIQTLQKSLTKASPANVDKLKNKLASYQALQSHYQEPQPYDYSLSVKTNNDGKVNGETLHTKYYSQVDASEKGNGNYGYTMELNDESIQHPNNSVTTVYGTKLIYEGRLYRRIPKDEEPLLVPKFDSLGTPGVTKEK